MDSIWENTREAKGVSWVNPNLLAVHDSGAGRVYKDEALLLQAEISKLKRPNQRVLDAYRVWFKKPYPGLGGLSKSFLDVPEDLVGLKTKKTDHLSLLLRRHWPTEVSHFHQASGTAAI
jgi:hypothetical protein